MKDNRKIEIGYRVRCSGYPPGTSIVSYIDPVKHKSGWFVPRKGCGPLAVFDNLSSAVRFAEDGDVIDKVAYIKSAIQDIQWHFDSYILRKDMPEGKDLADCFYILEENVFDWRIK